MAFKRGKVKVKERAKAARAADYKYIAKQMKQSREKSTIQSGKKTSKI